MDKEIKKTKELEEDKENFKKQDSSTDISKDVRIKKLEQDIEECEQRYLRLMADFENYRKRIHANISDANAEEKKRFIKELLDVFDNLGRAIEHSNENDQQNVIEGIKQVYKQFEDILKRHDVEKIDPAGEEFNPHFHEVLDTVKNEKEKDMKITKVYKQGYIFQGKLLRPALVQVIKNED